MANSQTPKRSIATKWVYFDPTMHSETHVRHVLMPQLAADAHLYTTDLHFEDLDIDSLYGSREGTHGTCHYELATCSYHGVHGGYYLVALDYYCS